ncbi:hypothetical protein H8Z59_27985 [Mycolicibacterium fortuitum]|uniref:hypothetical protein n=1 Tax=Mycolicibacterium fortuitum TaxID=1766 RepID=UPI001CDD859B|nr:hypothetical protein [Mycolicibacterium fortuitum]UBV20990.1 hypothetical protein H8Z59_27985 [Mycolicibacterium fortuitum]
MTMAVENLLASKDSARRSDLATLGGEDIADLTLRAGDLANPYQLKALSILAARSLTDGDVTAALTSLVDQLLSAPDITDQMRAEIISCAAAAHSDSLSVLMAATQDPVEDVAIEAWRALQLIARSADLADLQNAAPGPGTLVGDQAAFTMALVAYRGGVAGFELPYLDDAHVVAIVNDEEELTSISQSATTDEEFALVEELSSTELYLVSAQLASTTTIRCGGQQMFLCLDPELQPGWPTTLTELPAMLGVILMVDPLTTTAAVRFLVLSTPDGEAGFYAGAYLPSGEPVYQGHARADNITADTATLSWWAIDRPGVRPISLDLSVGSAGIELAGDRLSAFDVYRDRLQPASVPKI